jgi:hypothetical protein
MQSSAGPCKDWPMQSSAGPCKDWPMQSSVGRCKDPTNTKKRRLGTSSGLRLIRIYLPAPKEAPLQIYQRASGRLCPVKLDEDAHLSRHTQAQILTWYAQGWAAAQRQIATQIGPPSGVQSWQYNASTVGHPLGPCRTNSTSNTATLGSAAHRLLHLLWWLIAGPWLVLLH